MFNIVQRVIDEETQFRYDAQLIAHLVPSSYRICFSFLRIFSIISSLRSLGKMLKCAVQMLRSGLTLTLVTLTITPCIERVCCWKITLSSFCSSRAILFCLVSCIFFRIFVRLQRYKKNSKIYTPSSKLSIPTMNKRLPSDQHDSFC